MSRENVDVVRSVCDAWVRGEPDAVWDSMDPGVEWDTTNFEAWPENEIYRGQAEVRRFLDEWLASWDGYQAGVEELLDAGADQVVAFWWQRMTGRGSGVPVELDSAQVLTVRDGRVIRVDNYTDRDEALRAAGLRD